MTDLEVEKSITLKPIKEVAKELDLTEDDLDLYGKYKAKLNDSILNKKNHNGNVILVTAITPTKAGEGKTTVSIGLAQALKKLNKNVCLALREPSLGPVMGLKGGATGGGYSQVHPMVDINFHFTGDMHALTTANNLISAVIDNEIYFNSDLKLDPNRVVFRRCLDVNDRTLRSVKVGQGSKINGVERNDEFRITVASELMAVLCLSKDLADLENRLNNILIGYNYDGKEVYLKSLGITGALLITLKDAIKPNLVQTTEGVPAIIHGGPFANIAHGCNSIRATNFARHLADIVVTEAGFGADLGMEKFLDIKARVTGINPKCIVLIATIRALKMHGGVELENLKNENIDAMIEGCKNLERHIQTIKNFNKKFVVAINRFYTDTDSEIKALEEYLENKGYKYALTEIYSKGGSGGIKLAEEVLSLMDSNDELHYLYEKSDTLENKIINISKKAYGAKNVIFSDLAKEKLEYYQNNGFGDRLICMAKTQNSVTDNAKVLNAPTDFDITVRDISLSNGAGFIVAYTGKIITMPGLPEVPQAKKMGLDENNEPFGVM